MNKPIQSLPDFRKIEQIEIDQYSPCNEEEDYNDFASSMKRQDTIIVQNI